MKRKDNTSLVPQFFELFVASASFVQFLYPVFV